MPIRQKFWNPIIALMRKMGFPNFTHEAAFLTVGRLTDAKVVDKNQSGVLFLAWRCLYAELVRGRVENVAPNLESAYRRMLEMNISRLKAYGERWLKWVRKDRHTGNKSKIPERHQDKRVIRQDEDGIYRINQIFYDEYTRMTAT